jgi:hypothetical protein
MSARKVKETSTKTQKRIYVESVVFHTMDAVQLAKFLEMTVLSVCCLTYQGRQYLLKAE